MTFEDIRVDLHIHTCLSPCADDTMTPMAVVRQAKQRGLGLIGICDHNSAENVAAVRRAGDREGMAVVGGMEITTSEEIHIMGFFDDTRALAMQAEVFAHLRGRNDPDRFGLQVVMDENGRALALNERLLIGATDLSIDRVVDRIHDLGGVAIASHVNRQAFSIMSQLGFVPPGLPLDGLELILDSDNEAGGEYYETLGLPILTSSDAHALEDIGTSYTTLRLGRPSFGELAQALKGTGGRGVKI